MEGLKREFLNSSNAVNFIICLWKRFDAGIAPFELKNNLTGERLVFWHFNGGKWLLVRCPTERDEAKWAKWEKEAAEMNWSCMNWSCPWNRIIIGFNDMAIDDGLLDANEGPSEPKKRKN